MSNKTTTIGVTE